MKRFKVSEVAKQFGLSTTAIYKHLKRVQTRLKDHVFKDGGLTLISEEGVNILRESITIPTVPSREVTPAAAPDNRLDGIEKAVLATAEQMRVMSEQMKSMVEENRSLRSEVSLLRGLLPAPVEKPVIKEKAITPAPIRAAIVQPTQRKVSFWESVRLGLDDCCGLLFGRG